MLVASILFALVITRHGRSPRPTETDRVALFGLIAIAAVVAGVWARLFGPNWWWVADVVAFFATFSFRTFARPLW